MRKCSCAILCLFSGAVIYAQSPVAQIASRVQELVAKGDLAGARAELDAAAATASRDPAFFNLLGIVEAQAGNERAAELAFQNAIRLAPHEVPAYENLGRLYQQHPAEDPQVSRRAVETYRRLLRIAPENLEGNFQLARLLAFEGAYADSQAHLRRLSPEILDQPGSLAIFCVDYAGSRESFKAQAAAARLLKHPNLVEADVIPVARALEKAGASDIAEMLLDGVAGRGLASAKTLRHLAALYESRGQLSKAREAFEAATPRDGVTVQALLDLARVAFKQRDFKGTLGYLAHARDLDPRNPGVHFFFAIASIELNLPIVAEESLNEAIKLNPSNPYYHYAMASVKLERLKYDEAFDHFLSYAKGKPDDPRGPLMIGITHYRTQQEDLAVGPLRRAAAHPETAAVAHYFLGRIAMRQGRPEQASGEYEQALAANPKYADAYAELGSVRLAGERFDEARRAIARALELDPNHYAANFYLLKLYRKSHDPHAAEQEARFNKLHEKQFEDLQLLLRTIQAKPY